MALEALAASDLSNFIIYDTICASKNYCYDSSPASFNGDQNPFLDIVRSEKVDGFSPPRAKPPNSAAQGRKKRRRRPRVCLNKEEAENQRMTHIAVERNRRKQMNEHLAVLRSLMPESYVQRGDQASIVGGAIDFVKELEQLLQSLEAQKLALQQERGSGREDTAISSICNNSNEKAFPLPFAQFFSHPQYSWCREETQQSVAEIEVTLVETHANLRILSKRRPKQLLKMVCGLQALRLSILHLSVTTLIPFVLYSISGKVEEGCGLGSVDEIAGAVHHMLSAIAAEEAALC